MLLGFRGDVGGGSMALAATNPQVGMEAVGMGHTAYTV